MPVLLDWRRIDNWTDCIDRGVIEPIATVFESFGAEPPDARWNPAVADLPAEPLRFLLDHWQSLPRQPDIPHQRDIDPVSLRPALGYIMLLDAVEGGRDFHVRLYGSTIAEISGFDLTGKRLSEHRASAYTTEFAIAASRAALNRRQPLYTTRRPVAADFTSQWPRLALPFADDQERATRLLVGTVALGRDGRVIKL
jgi:hypothetical protein